MQKIILFLLIFNLNGPVINAQSYKAGDRVMVDINMSGTQEYQRWKKATVINVQQWNGQISGYSIKTDEGGEYIMTERFMRKFTEDKKPAENIEKKNQVETDHIIAKDPDGYLFTEPAGTVTKSSMPSAELFKRVIYEYQNDIKRGTKLCITFEKFELGKSFKNVITAKGRLLDFVPTDVIVYPVKTKQGYLRATCNIGSQNFI